MGVTPPPFPRTPTKEIDDRLVEFSAHLRGISDELKAERDAREKREKSGVSILNLHVPFLAVLLTFGGVATAGLLGGMFIHNTTAHQDDKVIHADRTRAIQRDGIAYARDVKDAVESEASDRAADVRRMDRAIRKGAQCKPSKIRGELSCVFEDPEKLPLRSP
jgi:hypothetical protein